MNTRTICVAGLLVLAAAPCALAADDAAEIAKKLSNPVASMISLPFQSNFDFGGGPNDDGFQYKLNIQPVIPFALNDKWNLITRTILPYIYQDKRIGDTCQSGLGDTTLSMFFSPKELGPGGFIWGVGPDFYLPTATDELLGAEKWGAGPTALVLKQENGWTYGLLTNHIWSFAGEDERQDVNNTYLQPFLAYQTKANTTFAINTESSYDWENEQWTVPLNATITQLVMFGSKPVSFMGGVRYYTEKPEDGPDWGLRLAVTFVF